MENETIKNEEKCWIELLVDDGDGRYAAVYDYLCPICATIFSYPSNYCPNCGEKLKHKKDRLS